MRILTVGTMYPPHHLGGYELLWQAAVRGLRAAGHEVRVLATDHRQDGVGAEEDAEVYRALRWYWADHAFPRLGWRDRRRLDAGNAAVWDEHVASFAPDVVSYWAMGGLSMSLFGRGGLPALSWAIDAWPTYGPRVDQYQRLRRRRLDFAGGARWVFCSEALRDELVRFVPALAGGLVEPPGVAPSFTAHPEQDWSGKLLYVGRIDERKGIATAIEALTSLPRMTLRIVGGGDARELKRLQELAARCAVGDRVEFSTPVSRAALAGVYAAADVTLFPVTWFEPFGLVPLESMAVGRPVVATGVGGSGDYLRDGENALLYRPGDAAGLADRVRRLSEDAILRRTLRAGGIATAAELTEARWLAAVCARHEEIQSTR